MQTGTIREVLGKPSIEITKEQILGEKIRILEIEEHRITRVVGEIDRGRLIKAATEEQRVKPMISSIASKDKQI